MQVSNEKSDQAGERIAASDFKARCLRIIDEVERTGQSYVITKHGKPKAVLSPVSQQGTSLRGAWKDIGRITGDIVHCDWSDEFDVLK